MQDIQIDDMEEQASLSSIIIKYSVAFLMIIIILISVLGNLLVCLAICIDRRLRNSGKGNWFLISLACADLLVGLLVMSLSLVYSLLDQWVFGELLCRVWISMDVMCCTSSILNLCAICIDRFLHIKDPYNYDNYMSRKVVLLSIFLIWSVSAFISFVPLNLGWHKLDIFQFVQPHETNNLQQITSKQSTINNDQATTNKLNNVVGQLTADQRSETKEELKCDLGFSPLYAVISSSISFYLPCIIMVALYTRLYLVARKHVRDIRKICKPQLANKREDNLIQQKQQDLNSPLKTTNHLLTCIPNTGSNRSCRSATGQLPITTAPGIQQRSTTINQHIADHKAAITIGIILFSFLFCWIPFFLMNIYLSFCDDDDCVPSNIFQFLTWLGWCNSALNPIIYTIFNREFRSAFYRLLTTWPIGNCSLFKIKHRFSTQPSNIQQHQLEHQLELRCSRATGSSECSMQPANIIVNNIANQEEKNIEQPQTPINTNNTLSGSLPNTLTKTDIQLQSNLSTNEEIKKQPEQEQQINLKNKYVHCVEQSSSKKDSLKNRTICNDEQKMMMVSITNNSSKDAVIV